jgi:hypothetical protein
VGLGPFLLPRKTVEQVFGWAVLWAREHYEVRRNHAGGRRRQRRRVCWAPAAAEAFKLTAPKLDPYSFILIHTASSGVATGNSNTAPVTVSYDQLSGKAFKVVDANAARVLYADESPWVSVVEKLDKLSSS